jgi:hypothetical protein
VLDIAIEQGSKRRHLHLSAWRFPVELQKKCLCGFPSQGFRCVLIPIAEDHARALALPFGICLVIPELPNIGAPLALPQTKASILIPCPN